VTWRENLNKIKPEDVATVCQITNRDATGIDYEICLSLRSLAVSAFEHGEDQIIIWSDRVDFGQTNATAAGGADFVEMARKQQWIANECCEYAAMGGRK
jgi:hypothetical protein